jgi:hypothetical protein
VSHAVQRPAVPRAALWAGGCVALALGSIALPGGPSYDPWAWITFGREIVDPGLSFSTHASTGWKPLPVLFTAPLALFGPAAPSLWLAVVRAAGLGALALAFRLGTRAAGPIAGAIAALALLTSADWVRYLAAGNIEPVVIALLLGAIALHLTDHRGGAFVLGAMAGLARPEAWLLVGLYALDLLIRERRWWPLLLGVPGMLALWIVPDWLGSGDLLHTFHAAEISAEPRTLQDTGDPSLHLVRGALGIVVVPVWIGALGALVLAWHDRTVRAVAVVVAGWTLPTVAATAVGYPAVPRYLVEPVALCCVLCGIGVVAIARLATTPRRRVALVAGLAAAFAPFAVARTISLAHQASNSKARADALAQLWHAADAAQHRAPVARMHPVIQPSGLANGLVWKLHVRLRDVSAWFTPLTRVAFINGDTRPVIARLHRRDASARQIASSGPWRVLLVRWPASSQAGGLTASRR